MDLTRFVWNTYLVMLIWRYNHCWTWHDWSSTPPCCSISNISWAILVRWTWPGVYRIHTWSCSSGDIITAGHGMIDPLHHHVVVDQTYHGLHQLMDLTRFVWNTYLVMLIWRHNHCWTWHDWSFTPPCCSQSDTHIGLHQLMNLTRYIFHTHLVIVPYRCSHCCTWLEWSSAPPCCGWSDILWAILAGEPD